MPKNAAYSSAGRVRSSLYINAVRVTFYCLSCCFIPGSSLLGSKYKRYSGLIPLASLAWVFAVSWSRWITTAQGLLALFIGLLLIHTASYLLGLYACVKQPANHSAFRITAAFLALACINVSIALACHQFKEEMLGFAFFHIPSASMSPTLLPGDVLLVDTWAYQQKPAAINEVIVFQRSPKHLILIKRITEITGMPPTETKKFYVKGDNPNRSVGSEQFGLITQQQLIGKACFIWFSFTDHKRRLQRIH